MLFFFGYVVKVIFLLFKFGCDYELVVDNVGRDDMCYYWVEIFKWEYDLLYFFVFVMLIIEVNFKMEFLFDWVFLVGKNFFVNLVVLIYGILRNKFLLF